MFLVSSGMRRNTGAFCRRGSEIVSRRREAELEVLQSSRGCAINEDGGNVRDYLPVQVCVLVVSIYACSLHFAYGKRGS
jgi:hypothetical protein